jgi:hypothetical protein
MGGLSSLFFGCAHRNTSRPFTSRQRAAEIDNGVNVAGTYIVCLDCGKEFAYSWEEMRVLSNGKLEQAEQAGSSEPPHKVSRWRFWQSR